MLSLLLLAVALVACSAPRASVDLASSHPARSAPETAFAASGSAEVDRLQEALDLVGFSRQDLGYRPRGYWSRFPSIEQVPYLLPFFKDLFAEPMNLYAFSRVMAGALEEHLDPDYRARYDNAMFKVVHFLGVEKKIVGPRGYDYAADFGTFAGRDGLMPDRDSMQDALSYLYDVTGNSLSGPDLERIERRLTGLPEELHAPLAGLLWQIAEAWRWREMAVAELDPEDMETVFAAGPPAQHRQRETPDRGFCPAIRRVANDLDEISLYHAAQLTVAAVEKAANAFQEVLDTGLQVPDLYWELPTPAGKVVIAGTGDDHHVCTGHAVVVDLGGNDVYEGACGGTPSLDIPISVVIDLGGDDHYRATGSMPAQGAAILGVGVSLNMGGNNRYEAENFAQGAGYFGLGLLWDESGDDEYRLEGFGGQGGAYFGIGLLVDVAGDDRYYLWGDGQGFGGVGGGVGVLADASGDDHYVAEVDARITGRGSPHSGHRVTSSQAQGAGIGRRGDIWDGHIWAGGLGALIDLEGDDRYEAGNWALGSGYWFGTGIMYDGGGNDFYQGVYYSLASGAHFALSAVINEDGDDHYRLWDPPIPDEFRPDGRGMNAAGGAGLAFGWDFVTTLLLDKGGNDTYEAQMISGGLAMIRSVAILADLSDGDDVYILPASRSAGEGSLSYIGYPDEVLPSFLIEYSPASHYGINFGMMLDTGGQDRYYEWSADGQHRPSQVWRNDHLWFQPSPDELDYDYRSRGIGMNVEGGTIPEFHWFERRSAP